MVRKKKNKKSDFDLTYINNYHMFEELGKRALEILNDSEYEALCAKAEEEKGFCHHDYTYHNIVVNDNMSVSVVDFDYCKREIRVYDIWEWMSTTPLAQTPLV